MIYKITIIFKKKIHLLVLKIIVSLNIKQQFKKLRRKMMFKMNLKILK